MSTATLAGPTPIVKVPNGDPGVVYRECAGFPRYAVGDDGSVWSFGPYNAAVKKWRRVKARIQSSGYELVGLYIGKRVRFGRLVHRLVLEAFVGPCPPGMEACHDNGDGTDNREQNLRWDTRGANVADKIRHGRQPRGEGNGQSVLSEADVREIRRRRAGGEPYKEIATAFRVCVGTIEQIVARKIWGWLE